MSARVYFNIVLTLLLLAVVFFGVSVTRAFDRQHRTYLKQLAGGSAVPDNRAAAADGVPPRANVEFFVPDSPEGGRIVRAIASETQNLNPLITNEATVGLYNGLCNSTLGERNFADPMKWEPLLAESWTISPDHKEYRIKLLKGVLWQDVDDPVTGKKHRKREVTAADFKFYLDVIRDPEVNCAPLRGYYQELKEIEIVNDYEFIVRWQSAYYGSLASTFGMSPLPKHFYDYGGGFDGRKFNLDHARNRMIVGCGPYKLVRWDKGSRLLFEAFDGYFGGRYGVKPPLRYLAFELIQHPNTRLQALLAGTLDQLQLTGEQWKHSSNRTQFKDGTVKRFRYLNSSYSYIGYNQLNPLFRDRKVRQALTMLVDREKLKNIVHSGEAEIAVGPFNPDSPYFDRSIRPWPYDVERAKRQLAEAGWRPGADGILEKDGRKFSFTMLQIASHPLQEKMMPLLKEFFAAAGIEMKIQLLEWSVYIQKLERKEFDACSLGWTSPVDPDPYQVWHSSGADVPGSSNHIGFKNPDADRIIGELRGCFEPQRRIELAREFQQLLHDEQPYTFLFVPYSLVAQSGRYRNVRVFSGGIADELMYVPSELQKPVPGW